MSKRLYLSYRMQHLICRKDHQLYLFLLLQLISHHRQLECMGSLKQLFLDLPRLLLLRCPHIPESIVLLQESCPHTSLITSQRMNLQESPRRRRLYLTDLEQLKIWLRQPPFWPLTKLLTSQERHWWWLEGCPQDFKRTTFAEKIVLVIEVNSYGY